MFLLNMGLSLLDEMPCEGPPILTLGPYKRGLTRKTHPRPSKERQPVALMSISRLPLVPHKGLAWAEGLVSAAAKKARWGTKWVPQDINHIPHWASKTKTSRGCPSWSEVTCPPLLCLSQMPDSQQPSAAGHNGVRSCSLCPLMVFLESPMW